MLLEQINIYLKGVNNPIFLAAIVEFSMALCFKFWLKPL